MAGPGFQKPHAEWKGAAPGDVDDEIIPRDIHFQILGNAKRYWFGGDLAKTVIVDGLSIFLPDGERFFIRSLKHYGPKLKNRELAAEINGYAVQEAFHTREHEDYNKAMTELGYPVKAMEKSVGDALGVIKSPLFRLATTCAIEHLTATFSTMTLRHMEWFDDAEPAYRRLWLWHALEELEHKAVALDVLKAATPKMPGWQRYLLRISAMNATIIPFLLIFLKNVRLYARADGVKTGLRFWLHFANLLFISPGFWRKCLPLFARYYLPGFDPANKDDHALVRKGRAWLYAEFSRDAAAVGKAG